MQITAKKKVEGEVKEVTIEFDFGENLKAARGLFGDEVIFSKFKAAAKIEAQATMRRLLDRGLPPNEVAAKMAEWKPGVTVEVASDPVASIIGKYKNMDEQQKQEFIRRLQAASGEAA